MFNLKVINRFVFFVYILLLQACTTPHYNEALEKTLSAQWTRTTSSHNDLISLPRPSGRITVSVYGFLDQTGQYNHQTELRSFSHSVTTCANSILE